MTDFKLPELGENVTGGDVLRLLVKPGDTVANEQPVIELETDKATFEVPSSVAGTVTDVKVKPGDKVKVGQTILTVEEGKDSKEAKGSKEQAKDSSKPKPQPVGASEDGGLSQEATSGLGGGASSGREPAREDREGDRAGVADDSAQGRRPTQRLPEDEVEESPRQKRGEVVDISRASRAAAP